MDSETIRFFAQAGISVCGAFLAAYLASRRFRSEKWWEKKAAAYDELVDALHTMWWAPAEIFDAELLGRTLPQEESAANWEEFKVARRNIWRLSARSSFLISDEVLEAVRQLERELGKAENSQSWAEHADAQSDAIRKCLDAVKAIGRKELGL